MRRTHRERKFLNESLGPLVRFLGSRVGKHWNKVDAEICEHLRRDSALQQHARDHLGDIVALDAGKARRRQLSEAREGDFFAAGPSQSRGANSTCTRSRAC